MSIFQKIKSKNFLVGYQNAKFKDKIFRYSKYFSSNVSSNQEEIPAAKEPNRSFVTFQEQTLKRKNEAKTSIIVQVQSHESYKELYSYCSSFGNIKNMFHYTTGIEPMHFILIEYQKVDDVQAALSSGTFIENNTICPTKSQFLWFRAGPKKKSGKKFKGIELSVIDGLKKISNEKLISELNDCENVSDQIYTLYDKSKLTDLEIRLRFLTAMQIEASLSGLFPNAEVLPFGSTVNGFGKMGCDLDVVLTLNQSKDNPNSRLVFHCKGSHGLDRALHLRNLETIGDIMHLFLPGCTRIRKILQARVPIIKYYQQFTDVECDVSISNVSGVHMSDFLFIMGALDSRVTPLVFAIRRWAKDVGLTHNTPGRWITNFPLTLMVLAFLQKPLYSKPILPALNTLIKSAGTQDAFITEEGVDCTFLRNIENLHHTISNTESLENLLCEFFEYCAQFDFKERALCLNEAVTLSKPDNSALYIVNPLERGLNVSKNVSLEELDRFKEEARNAAWNLQSGEERTSKTNWGLLSILGNNRKKPKFTFNFNIPRNQRLMHVKELFVEGEDDVEEMKVEYKNDSVKKQVKNIKKQNGELVKRLKNIKEPVR